MSNRDRPGATAAVLDGPGQAQPDPAAELERHLVVDGERPDLPERYWIAETATVIGRVRLKSDASVWFGSVLRGDNEWIEIGVPAIISAETFERAARRHHHGPLHEDEIDGGDVQLLLARSDGGRLVRSQIESA